MGNIFKFHPLGRTYIVIEREDQVTGFVLYADLSTKKVYQKFDDFNDQDMVLVNGFNFDLASNLLYNLCKNGNYLNVINRDKYNQYFQGKKFYKKGNPIKVPF